MGERDAYVQKMKAKLDEWNSEIDRLAEKTNAAKADAKLRYQEQVDRLKAQSDTARRKLDELGAASESAWKDLRTGWIWPGNPSAWLSRTPSPASNDALRLHCPDGSRLVTTRSQEQICSGRGEQIRPESLRRIAGVAQRID